jgi:hypothetical protein
LALFFVSNRNAVGLDRQIWMATRPNRSSDWRKPVNILLYGTGGSISGDGRILVYASGPRNGIGVGAVKKWEGELDHWEVPIIPNLDFNSDGNIDNNDLKLLNDNQGITESQNKSIYDIGPMPWGDGVVDTKDIEVFMEYLK